MGIQLEVRHFESYELRMQMRARVSTECSAEFRIHEINHEINVAIPLSSTEPGLAQPWRHRCIESSNHVPSLACKGHPSHAKLPRMCHSKRITVPFQTRQSEAKQATFRKKLPCVLLTTDIFSFSRYFSRAALPASTNHPPKFWINHPPTNQLQAGHLPSPNSAPTYTRQKFQMRWV